MKPYKKIIAVCPGNTVTGGPEAMHHLVHMLRKMGHNAEICYFPTNQTFITPEAYRGFDVRISEYNDIEGNLIIFPETFPMEAMNVKKARAAIWWLSVDHFTGYKHESTLRDRFNYLKLITKGLRPLRGAMSLNKIIHFSQSHYSTLWLSEIGLTSHEMYEPINQAYLEPATRICHENRADQILYNPSKGKKTVDALINKYPQFEFIPLQKLSRDQLIQLYCSSKVYIDFGHHPGRDRIPREAAVLGCCLITSRKGSAANPIDIPIDDLYKLDTDNTDFLNDFGILLESIISDFAHHYTAQEGYRQRILGEPAYFEINLKNIFSAAAPTSQQLSEGFGKK